MLSKAAIHRDRGSSHRLPELVSGTAAPAEGAPPRVHWYGWLAGIGGNLLLVGLLVLVARKHGGSFRAAVLAVAAGSRREDSGCSSRAC